MIDVGCYMGRKIRHYRQLRGMTSLDLGVKLGIEGSQVRTWELGRRTPNAWSLARLARVLGVEPADLFPKLAEIGGEVSDAPYTTP